MAQKRWPTCMWTGVGPDGSEVLACDRPAKAVFLDAQGYRRYACVDHLAYVKARASEGDGLRSIDQFAAPPGTHRAIPLQVVVT